MEGEGGGGGGGVCTPATASRAQIFANPVSRVAVKSLGR